MLIYGASFRMQWSELMISARLTIRIRVNHSVCLCAYTWAVQRTRTPNILRNKQTLDWYFAYILFISTFIRECKIVFYIPKSNVIDWKRRGVKTRLFGVSRSKRLHLHLLFRIIVQFDDRFVPFSFIPICRLKHKFVSHSKCIERHFFIYSGSFPHHKVECTFILEFSGWKMRDSYLKRVRLRQNMA